MEHGKVQDLHSLHLHGHNTDFWRTFTCSLAPYLGHFPNLEDGYSRDGITSFPRFQAKRFRKCESNLEARHEAELLNSFQENSHLAHLHPTHTSQTTMTIINKQEALLRNPARHPPHPHRQERVQHDECEVPLDWLIPKNAQPAQPVWNAPCAVTRAPYRPPCYAIGRELPCLIVGGVGSDSLSARGYAWLASPMREIQGMGELRMDVYKIQGGLEMEGCWRSRSYLSP